MTEGFLAWLSSALLLLGSLIGLIGAIGVLRLPDSYTRMHAASKAGALGAALILGGVAAATSGAFALAAMFALVIVLATAPLAAHAMARAAHRSGLTPHTGALGDEMARDGRLEGGPAHKPASTVAAPAGQHKA